MNSDTFTTTSVLVIGALGQIGSELVEALYEKYGIENVIASDIQSPEHVHIQGVYVQLDVMDKEALFDIIKKYKITDCYNLAALLSATGEKKPELAWKLNMEGLLNSLEAARQIPHFTKLFWPSSIAVFGPNSPRVHTPQYCVMDPTSVYGISKLAGERWCEYYAMKYGIDVRSIRYPGLIGYKSAPGGGTTDYAVHIFHAAIEGKDYVSFLQKDTALPMMYMEDAIRATLSLMDAPAENVTIRSSYNLGGISFTPEEIAASIQAFYPDFTCTYEPDARQQIADSWPQSIDDAYAQRDWDWKTQFDLGKMTEDMIFHLKQRLIERNIAE